MYSFQARPNIIGLLRSETYLSGRNLFSFPQKMHNVKAFFLDIFPLERCCISLYKAFFPPSQQYRFRYRRRLRGLRQKPQTSCQDRKETVTTDAREKKREAFFGHQEKGKSTHPWLLFFLLEKKMCFSFYFFSSTRAVFFALKKSPKKVRIFCLS